MSWLTLPPVPPAAPTTVIVELPPLLARVTVLPLTGLLFASFNVTVTGALYPLAVQYGYGEIWFRPGFITTSTSRQRTRTRRPTRIAGSEPYSIHYLDFRVMPTGAVRGVLSGRVVDSEFG